MESSADVVNTSEIGFVLYDLDVVLVVLVNVVVDEFFAPLNLFFRFIAASGNGFCGFLEINDTPVSGLLLRHGAVVCKLDTGLLWLFGTRGGVMFEVVMFSDTRIVSDDRREVSVILLRCFVVSNGVSGPRIVVAIAGVGVSIVDCCCWNDGSSTLCFDGNGFRFDRSLSLLSFLPLLPPPVPSTSVLMVMVIWSSLTLAVLMD